SWAWSGLVSHPRVRDSPAPISSRVVRFAMSFAFSPGFCGALPCFFTPWEPLPVGGLFTPVAGGEKSVQECASPSGWSLARREEPCPISTPGPRSPPPSPSPVASAALRAPESGRSRPGQRLGRYERASLSAQQADLRLTLPPTRGAGRVCR